MSTTTTDRIAAHPQQVAKVLQLAVRVDELHLELRGTDPAMTDTMRTATLSVASANRILATLRKTVAVLEAKLEAKQPEMLWPTTSEYPGLEPGYYAVLDKSDDPAFFQVRIAASGTIYVRRQSGSNYLTVPPVHAHYVARTVVADPLVAIRRYGRELEKCGRCRRPLTTVESREKGLGPTCSALLGCD